MVLKSKRNLLTKIRNRQKITLSNINTNIDKNKIFTRNMQDSLNLFGLVWQQVAGMKREDN